MKKTTLITGVAGTTGSLILKEYLHHNPEVLDGTRHVIGVDNLFRGSMSNISQYLSNSNFSFYPCSFQDLMLTSKSGLLKNYEIDEIYHMAAVVPTKYFYSSPELTFYENCESTIKLFNWAIKQGVKGFIVGSTSEVYGHINPNHLPISEDEPSNFDSVETTTRWSYAEGKLLTEHVLNRSKDRIKVCHLRFANTYGVEDFDDNHIIPYLINCIVQNTNMHVNKSPHEFYRTFLNNKDSSRACIELMSKGRSGVAYNVGSSEEVTIAELLNLIQEVSEEVTGRVYSGHIFYDVDRPGDPKRRVLSTDRLYKDTGFVPQVSLREGIIEMVKEANDKFMKNQEVCLYDQNSR